MKTNAKCQTQFDCLKNTYQKQKQTKDFSLAKTAHTFVCRRISGTEIQNTSAEASSAQEKNKSQQLAMTEQFNMRIHLNQQLSTLGLQCLWGVTYQIFMLWSTIVAKSQLLIRNKNNFTVGGLYNIRNYIKVSQCKECWELPNKWILMGIHYIRYCNNYLVDKIKIANRNYLNNEMN